MIIGNYTLFTEWRFSVIAIGNIAQYVFVQQKEFG